MMQNHEKSLHMRTLLKNTVERSPLKRRSLIGTPLVLLDKCDDEIERSNRRSLVEMQKRLSNVHVAKSPTKNDTSSLSGEHDIKNHFQICTKLHTENKINSKNAWKLHIIDILKHMAQKKSSDTLQVAGTSLDISAKIYGIRVDDIHADGLKLASSMTRNAEKHAAEEGNSDENEHQESDKTKTDTKKKKKRKTFVPGNKNTISKDSKLLKAPLPKLESVFFTCRTDANASSVDNLFTNVLKLDNCGFKFMLLSKEKAWIENNDPVIKEFNDSKNSKKYKLSLKPIDGMTICAPFKDFHVDQWDPEEEEKEFVRKSLTSQRQQEVVYDDLGVPIPELDGSIHDIFMENDSVGEPMVDFDEETEENSIPQLRGEVVHIVDFKPDETGALQKSEYSYNSTLSRHESGRVVDQIWAGPSHWKFKHIRRSHAKFTGKTTTVETNTVRNARKNVPKMIEFDEEPQRFDLTKKLKVRRKPPTADVQKITLPIPDTTCLKLISNMSELMSKPGTCPVSKKSVKEDEADYEIDSYKYENPNDADYCSVLIENGGCFDEDCPPDDNFSGDHSEEVAISAQQNFLTENLVDAPEMIQNSYVPFAMHAKKIDMKKLKWAVKDTLVKKVHVNQEETKSTDVSTLRFSRICHEVPSMLPEKMRSELSCHLTFLALLHLCNEHNLELRQDSNDFTDFEVLNPNLV